MKATLTPSSSSPVKEKSFLIVDHLFLFANWKGMGKGRRQLIHAELQLLKDVNIFITSAPLHIPHAYILIVVFPTGWAPYLWDVPFCSASGCTEAKCDRISGGKKKHQDLDLGQRTKMPGIFQAWSYCSWITNENIRIAHAQWCCFNRDATCSRPLKEAVMEQKQNEHCFRLSICSAAPSPIEFIWPQCHNAPP